MSAPIAGAGRENLCDRARFTGYQWDGGYAEFTLADARYAFALPDAYTAVELAPLLCAGLFGHRALVMAGDGKRLGLYGFGAAAHIIAQVARHQEREVYAFTRPGDSEGQQFSCPSPGAIGRALRIGCRQTGSHAAILFAPIGRGATSPVLAKGGTVVCAGIHMSDIPTFPYPHSLGERTVCFVANLTQAGWRRIPRPVLPGIPALTAADRPSPWPMPTRPRHSPRAGRIEVRQCSCRNSLTDIESFHGNPGQGGRN